ncbi:Metallo-dependent phosphatase [Mytilinidion resinicola]|uniref:Metallo-dependent phosphatase n=1 Tax=Mytilinidion resinicola TaxID=574789 RepID=A0A6A6Y0T7_9PEZI|nr:Metallo-dependent phosphatase [Mytilinidion resinicola]KAF2801845.1 Metallo-dependent phosphatase [Mytilinidion resinicola]
MAPTNSLSPRVIKLPGQRLARLATSLLKLHPLHQGSVSQEPLSFPITAICISDTHNTQPDLPPGDILIHAGDLTENGSFDEVQAQLSWLAAQPHEYKIVVAGNHDVLLDAKFLEENPERRYGQSKTADDLDWGDVHYLQDSSLELEFPIDSQHASSPSKSTLRIYGSPWTPQYGISAFQYPKHEDIWSNKIPPDKDILITHGPPRLHLDKRGFHRAGCPFLAQEIARIRPRLVVFGHIHVAYEREDVVLDGAQRRWEEIINQWGGLRAAFRGRDALLRAERVTTFVNAAVVGGPKNELQNQPVVCVL